MPGGQGAVRKGLFDTATAVPPASLSMTLLAVMLLLAISVGASSEDDGDGVPVEHAVPDEPSGSTAGADDDADRVLATVAAEVSSGVHAVGEAAPDEFAVHSRGRAHREHLKRTGEQVTQLHAHRFNSDASVAAMQRSAPPLVFFKRRNFGLKPRVTHLVNLTFSVGGAMAGSVLLGLFGEDMPRAVANFVRLVEQSTIVGTRCVRVGPQYAIQCGDSGRADDLKFKNLRSCAAVATDGALDSACSVLQADELKPRVPTGRRGGGDDSAVGLRPQPGSVFVTVNRPRHDSKDSNPPRGFLGSHFVLSASAEVSDFARQQDRFHAIGVVLSGFSTVLKMQLTQHLALDGETLGPRASSSIAVRGAWSRVFPKGTLVDYERRFVGAAAEAASDASARDEVNQDGGGDSPSVDSPGWAASVVAATPRMAATDSEAPWRMDLPPRVVRRYYEPYESSLQKRKKDGRVTPRGEGGGSGRASSPSSSGQAKKGTASGSSSSSSSSLPAGLREPITSRTRRAMRDSGLDTDGSPSRRRFYRARRNGDVTQQRTRDLTPDEVNDEADSDEGPAPAEKEAP